MDFTEIMKQKIDYCSRHTDMPMELQQKARNYVGSITEQVRKKKRKEAGF